MLKFLIFYSLKKIVKEKIESLGMFYLLKMKIDESSSQELFSKNVQNVPKI
jgi:hypothetical protein